MAEVDPGAASTVLDGRYQLYECVGHGAMAKVYRAEDLRLKRTVAIKLMRTDDPVVAVPAEARNETLLLASLNHPSLVTLLDASLDPGGPGYLVMEFVDGPTLADRLYEGPLGISDAAHLAWDLASALHTVHNAGIVHRDVKPSNILLARTDLPARSYHAKLADFGVAAAMGVTSVLPEGAAVGTAAYLAPEQVRADPITEAADIYSLGLVLLEAATGERAFPEASGIGAAVARLLAPPTIPDHLGPQWSRLLCRMTATDPTARPTAKAVAHFAVTLAQSEPVREPVAIG